VTKSKHLRNTKHITAICKPTNVLFTYLFIKTEMPSPCTYTEIETPVSDIVPQTTCYMLNHPPWTLLLHQLCKTLFSQHNYRSLKNAKGFYDNTNTVISDSHFHIWLCLPTVNVTFNRATDFILITWVLVLRKQTRKDNGQWCTSV